MVSLIAVVGFPGPSYIGFILPIWAPIRWRLTTIGIVLLMGSTLYGTKASANP